MKSIEPPINPPSKDTTKYDLIVLGTPVWASKMSSPVRSYISMQKGTLPAVAFFCTQQGSGGKGAFESMEKAVGKEPIAVADFPQKSVLSGEFIAQLNSFISEVKG